MEVPIPMTTAALGGSIEVPNIDGAKGAIEHSQRAVNPVCSFAYAAKGMTIYNHPERGAMIVTDQDRDARESFEASKRTS